MRCAQLRRTLWIASTVFLIVACTRGADQGRNSPVILDEFEVSDDGDGLWVPVTTGGASRLFIVDTGSTKVVYDESLRSFLSHRRSVERSHTSDSTFRMDVFDAPAARLGRIELFPSKGRERPLVGCVDLSRFAAVSGVEIRGIVGMSFLSHHVVRLDFDRGKLSFLSSPSRDAGTAFPLEFERGVPLVSVELPGVGKRPFKIDTGFVGESGSLEGEVVSAMKERGLVTVLGADLSTDASGISLGRTLRVAEIKIGDFKHSNLIFSEHTAGVPSILGMGYLSRYVITFDFPHRMLYLKRGKNFSRRDFGVASHGCIQLGFGLTRHSDKTTVKYVIPSGQAAKAGVEPDDTILAVNGRNVADARLFSVHRLITDAPGDVRLTIERNGAHHDFILRRPAALVVANPDEWDAR